jgi:hypothetical protein
MSEDGRPRGAQPGLARAGDRKRATARPGAAGALSRSAGESAGDPEPITVVLGRFDALLSLGLAQTLGEDRSLKIVGADLDRADLEDAVASKAPRVVVLDEATVVQPILLERLRDAQPAIGIVVLAHLPTVAYTCACWQEEPAASPRTSPAPTCSQPSTSRRTADACLRTSTVTWSSGTLPPGPRL